MQAVFISSTYFLLFKKENKNAQLKNFNEQVSMKPLLFQVNYRTLLFHKVFKKGYYLFLLSY